VQDVHATGYNRRSIAVCYEGGYDIHGEKADTRTPEQKAALYQLLKSLRQDYPRARIVGHCELPGAHKPCPCFTASTEYSQLQP
jgi:N-acetyl-anhydromuramyl-L-alanine amidase AmpD